MASTSAPRLKSPSPGAPPTWLVAPARRLKVPSTCRVLGYPPRPLRYFPRGARPKLLGVGFRVGSLTQEDCADRDGLTPRVLRPVHEARGRARARAGARGRRACRPSRRSPPGCSAPSCAALSMIDPTPKAKNARGKGLAMGLSTTHVASSTRGWASSWVRLLPALGIRGDPRAARSIMLLARPRECENALRSGDYKYGPKCARGTVRITTI